MQHQRFDRILKTSRFKIQPAFANEDVRGRHVIDAGGARVGIVQDLFIDDNERRVRLIEIRDDASIPSYLVPVEAIVHVTRDVVQLDRDNSELPSMRDATAGELDHEEAEHLFREFGIEPYWRLVARGSAA